MLKPSAGASWVCPERATNGSRRAVLHDGILHTQCPSQAFDASRRGRPGIPACAVSSRCSRDRGGWRIGRKAPPAEPAPRRESCVERQHVRGRMADLENPIQGRMDAWMPSSQGLNLASGAVNHVEGFAPHFGGALDFLLTPHVQNRKAIEGEQKVFDLL